MPAELEQLESDLVAARSRELANFPLPGNFDLNHLRAIHRYMFGDVYEWAGELRTVDISKGSNRFAHHAFLECAAESLFANLTKERYLADLDVETFCMRAAFYLGELNALHPFREGNGRTQREFIQMLARRQGYYFLWKLTSKEEMLKASIASFRGDLTKLTALLRTILRERL